tara:strand:- start:252 stop:440 length:189 start_codon:yes stop_codon:yes gene_type:complete
MKSINRFENEDYVLRNEDNVALIEDVLKEYNSGIKHYMTGKHLTHKESWIFKRGYEFKLHIK